MNRTISHLAVAAAFLGLASLAAYEADAQRRGGGGGGMRGGGSMSMSRGGGGGGSGFSRGGSYSRPSGGYSRPSNGNWSSQRPTQRPSAGSGQRPSGSGAQRPSQLPSQGGNRNNISGGDRNNINTGNINTGNVNVNRDVHVDNDLPGWGGWHDYPLAAGVAIGAVATARAAAIGSAYYALPPGCAPYPWQTYTYYSCGGAYYRPQYEGDTIVYVTVAKPK